MTNLPTRRTDADTHERPAAPTHRHDPAALLGVFLISVLSVAAGAVCGQFVLVAGWGLRPAWIAGGLAGAVTWLVFVVLAAVMLMAGRMSRLEERERDGDGYLWSE